MVKVKIHHSDAILRKETSESKKPTEILYPGELKNFKMQNFYCHDKNWNISAWSLLDSQSLFFSQGDFESKDFYSTMVKAFCKFFAGICLFKYQ